MNAMTQNNATFMGGYPYWANACVGENGEPGRHDYAKGFSRAANILIELVLANQGTDPPIDEMIYPICFNMRHSVELRLKQAIEDVLYFAKMKKHNLEFSTNESHDLRKMWLFFAEHSKVIDDRYEPIATQLHAQIIDIADIDPTGQTFRYPFNKENQKHLVKVAVINVQNLCRSFAELEVKLDVLHKMSQDFRNEYEWGTFTKHLSRKNLFEIASCLPMRSTWTDSSFKEVKQAIKTKFDITCRELSRGIKLIEAHYELAPKIGKSIDLMGAKDEFIKLYFDKWFAFHSLRADTEDAMCLGSMRNSDVLITEMIADSETREQVWKALKPCITPEVLADLSALFYFGYEPDFSEAYISYYSKELRVAKLVFTKPETSAWNSFFHIFNKSNATLNILKSLYFLKKNELADQLVAAHQLDKKLPWLHGARSRTLFQKSSHYGYTT
jgi:hypothetical protein